MSSTCICLLLLIITSLENDDILGFGHLKIILFVQVSSVTDHIGAQESVAKSNDLDDDEGGGLVGV